jgi:hypothetical protein
VGIALKPRRWRDPAQPLGRHRGQVVEGGAERFAGQLKEVQVAYSGQHIRAVRPLLPPCLDSPLIKCRRPIGDTAWSAAKELCGPTSCGAERNNRFCQRAAKAELQLWPEEFWLRLWASGVGVAGLALAMAVALRARPSPSGGAASNPVPALCAACMVFGAVLGWDQRTAWTAFVESSDAVPAELAGFVPDGATVYWEGGLELLWLRLKRPSYFSCAQAAGVMFFRGTAMAYAHRSESLGRCGRPAAEHEARTTRAELRGRKSFA